MRPMILALACLTLAACAPGKVPPPDRNLVGLERAWANAFSDQPFDTGPVTILTSEQGALRSYTLAPCRGGSTVCAGSSRGRAGTVQVTPDFDVVSGVYPGRVFYLSPGGDGFMRYRGADYALSWDDESPINGLAVTRYTDQGQGLQASTQ